MQTKYAACSIPHRYDEGGGHEGLPAPDVHQQDEHEDGRQLDQGDGDEAVEEVIELAGLAVR